MIRVQHHLTEIQVERLKAMSETSGVSVSELVRRAVDLLTDPWKIPAKSTPMGDILAMKDMAKLMGVPIDSPDAFPGVRELVDADGNRTGQVVRIEPRSGFDADDKN
jgi:uncharacterized protein YqgV (UPF0045/DUF77 family)